MKEFFKKYYKKILLLLVIALIFIAISFLAMLILYAFGIIYFNYGAKFNVELFNSFKYKWYGILIIIIFQAITTTLLCFAPGTTMAFILLHQALYDFAWQAFLMAFVGGVLASFAMYFTGRFGGYNICKKILGEKECEKASMLLNNKGAVYFPLMILFPLFPDDALIMIAGTIKMKLVWFVPSIIIGRGVGIASIIFGLASIPYDKFTTPWHWVGFISVAVIGTLLVFFLAYLLNKHILNKKK